MITKIIGKLTMLVGIGFMVWAIYGMIESGFFTMYMSMFKQYIGKWTVGIIAFIIGFYLEGIK